MTIYDEIEAERISQDQKWGGASHDDTHNSHDWICYITKHLGKAVTYPWNHLTFRQQMVRIAALAVAAIEWCDRWADRYKSKGI